MNIFRLFATLGLLLWLVACSSSPGPGNGGTDGAITVDLLAEPGEVETGEFRLTNTSSEPVTYTITTRAHTRNGETVSQWFTIEPLTETIPGNRFQDIRLRTNAAFSEPGTYRSIIVVNYPGGPTEFDVTAQLQAEGEGANLSLSPSTTTATRGEPSAPITVSASGYSGTVTLSFERGDDGLPASQITISGSTRTITNSSTATLTVTPIADAAAGTYRVIVTGTSGSQSDTDVLFVTVPGGDGTGEEGISGTLRTDNALIPLTPPSTVAPVQLSTAQAAERPAYVPGQVLVKYRDGAQGLASASVETQAEMFQALASDFGLRVLETGTPALPAVMAVGPGESVESVAARLERDPRVAYAEPNYYIYTQAVPGDPQVDQLWNMASAGMPVAWSVDSSATSVTVAVIDTGIDIDHVDLADAFVAGGYDFCASPDCGSTDSNPRPEDEFWQHGTHVTGTLAAVGNNGMGVAGVLYGGASIVPIKAFYQDVTTAEALAEAIRYASGESVRGQDLGNAADIINLSVGTRADADVLRDAVADAQVNGSLIVASAGNDGAGSLFFPARYPGVLAVGAINSDFRRSCFSSYGAELDVMAAGGDGYLATPECDVRNDEAVWSTIPGDDYGIDAGTSMATPLAAGVAALILSQDPGLSNDEVIARLKAAAYFDSSYMSEDEYGAGVLRADVALGLPGPGDDATVTADGPESAVDTVELNLSGGSSSFLLDGLPAGSYTVEASASGSSHDLTGATSVSLSAGESETITIDLDVP